MNAEQSNTDQGASGDSRDHSHSTNRDGRTPDEGITGHDTRLLKGALGLLCLLAIVATIRLYFSVSNAIGIWVTHEFRPLAQAGFNLVVLLIVGAGGSIVLRRLKQA